jgi:hypothetical protein
MMVGGERVKFSGVKMKTTDLAENNSAGQAWLVKVLFKGNRFCYSSVLDLYG